MFDLFHPHLVLSLDLPPWVRDVSVAVVGQVAAGVLATSLIIRRIDALLRPLLFRGEWPGIVDPAGLHVQCQVCEHPLAVHDRLTGQCCQGTTPMRIAKCLVLPVPRRRWARFLKPTCPCRLPQQGD